MLSAFLPNFSLLQPETNTQRYSKKVVQWQTQLKRFKTEDTGKPDNRRENSPNQTKPAGYYISRFTTILTKLGSSLNHLFGIPYWSPIFLCGGQKQIYKVKLAEHNACLYRLCSLILTTCLHMVCGYNCVLKALFVYPFYLIFITHLSSIYMHYVSEILYLPFRPLVSVLHIAYITFAVTIKFNLIQTSLLC